MAGWFRQIKKRFSGGESKFGKNLTSLWSGGQDVQDKKERLEELLLQANFGVSFTEDFLTKLSKKDLKTLDFEQLQQALAGQIKDFIVPHCKALEIKPDQRPWVCLLVGVNGSGKTTTAGKLATRLVAEGKRVVLAGADLFRAAATAQSALWADRSDAIFFGAQEGEKDLGSFVFKAYEKAVSENADALIIDTAGRLHTQHNLMDELQKVVRVLQKKDPSAPHESLLVLDGTVGANAESQGALFGKAVPLSGLVITKLDGTSRPGSVLRVAESLKAPFVAFGVGEASDDLVPADAAFFANLMVGLA